MKDAFIWLNDPLNWTNPGGILERLGQHLVLSAGAILVACLVAWPIGLWLGHRGRGSSLVVLISNVTLAIPTLALLTILPLTVIGFGPLAVILALAVFAIPPLLATAHAGVRAIEPEVRDAAKGIGLSAFQQVSRVELPLARPFLYSGFRTAAVQVIATATLAALVDGGGLGVIINEGIGLQNYGQVIAGAFLVTTLCLSAEGVLAMLARFRMAKLPALMLIVACGVPGSSGTKPPPEDVTGPGCAPIAGNELVVLTDDKHLAYSDNLVPAINAKSATPEVVAVLNAVSASFDTDALRSLNAAVDIERKSPSVAAEEFASNIQIGQRVNAKLTIAAANFSENQIVANLYRIGLEKAGAQVAVNTVGNRELYEPALARGQFDIVPEYAGTFTEFLNRKLNGPTAPTAASGDIAVTMAALRPLAEREGLVVGEPSPATDQNAFAVTKAFAQEHGITTLTQFGEKCAGLASVLGGPPECPQRPQCQLGLEQTYGARFGRFVALDAGGPLTKTAMRTGRITLGLVLSSDAAFAG